MGLHFCRKRDNIKYMKKAVNIIINRQNKILILKRSSAEHHYPSFWDLPGGGVEKGESLRKAAEREAKEETGLDVKVDDNYFYVFRCNHGSEIEAFGFKANLAGEEIILSREHIESKWVSIDEYKNFKYTPGATAIIKEFFGNQNYYCS